MTTHGKSSKEPSQRTLFVPLSCYGFDKPDELRMSDFQYTSVNTSWKLAVSPFGSETRFTLYCRRKLSRDTVHAIYSVTLAVPYGYGGKYQYFFKQGHATFFGPMLETTVTFDLNIDYNIKTTNYNPVIEMHITSLEPPAENMSVEIYEDAFSSVNKSQLFSESSPFQSDCVISFEDEKEVHVNKNLLSWDSDWWKDMFAKYNDRVPLTNTDYEQFLDFLCVIYPTAHPVTAKNVETLSKFANDFKMTELLKRCDMFLLANSAKVGRSKLLGLAHNYNLERLQAHYISEYKSLEDIKAIKTEPEYADLHDRTKRMLLDKILGISSSVLSEAPVSENSSLYDLVINETSAKTSDKLAFLSSCRSDIILVVGNTQIPASKQLLSYFSEFFDKMFQSEFKESRESEITLEDIRYEEMVELLSVIYPSGFAINETNIATIAKLADYFKMPIILDRCQQELKKSSKIKGALKLWLAQRFNFSDLQLEFAREYNSLEDVEKLKDEPEFKLLDDKTRALILENITR